MDYFNNLKIPAKLILSFAVLIFAFVVNATIVRHQMATMNVASGEITDKWLPSMAAIREMETSGVELRRWSLRHILGKVEADMKRVDGLIKTVREKIADPRNKYETLITTPDERALYDELGKTLAQLYLSDDKVQELSHKNQKEGAQAAITGEGTTIFNELWAILTRGIALNAKGAATADAIQVFKDAA